MLLRAPNTIRFDLPKNGNQERSNCLDSTVSVVIGVDVPDMCGHSRLDISLDIGIAAARNTTSILLLPLICS
jgi:hypothetical protein